MGDKYIEQLHALHEEDVRSKKSRHFRHGYKDAKSDMKKSIQGAPTRRGNQIRLANTIRVSQKDYSPSSPENRAYALAVAHDLLGESQSTEDALLAARVYEKLGLGGKDSVKRRLLKARREYRGTQNDAEIEDFLERNASEHSDLEKTVSAAVMVGGVGLGLGFLSGGITGNVIGLSGGGSVLGAGLLVLGLVGAWFFVKS